MLKKSTVLLNPYHGIYSPHASPSSPLCSRCPRKNFSTSPRTQAIVSQGYSRSNHDSDLHWPEVTNASLPTPYQIFNQKKGSPYSKRRFYELVKLYHPDRHSFDSSSVNDLPYAVKLERYRLVVAANEILSDEKRRVAYDRYGAGWNGQPSINSTADGSPWNTETHGRGADPEIWRCANWEDWEKYRNKEPQANQFTSNPAFVLWLLILASIGILAEATRASRFSNQFMDKTAALHSEMSRDLMQRRRQTRNSYGDRDGRVSEFLRQRNEGLIGTEAEFLIRDSIGQDEEVRRDPPDKNKTKESQT